MIGGLSALRTVTAAPSNDRGEEENRMNLCAERRAMPVFCREPILNQL
jgi:hypothetical protein